MNDLKGKSVHDLLIEYRGLYREFDIKNVKQSCARPDSKELKAIESELEARCTENAPVSYARTEIRKSLARTALSVKLYQWRETAVKIIGKHPHTDIEDVYADVDLESLKNIIEPFVICAPVEEEKVRETLVATGCLEPFRIIKELRSIGLNITGGKS